ncbi:MAG: hypothetical protein JO064_11645 [Actinobacteria bacterium]|nr:hypothetical protein [Actinomycetota bacterium]MBV8598610.1 hypothetical protein [Actinomycetota bacterium]
MTVWGALAGGAVGTVVLEAGVRIATQVGLTRIDLPFLLGTIFTEQRRRAVVVGYLVHFVNGLLFALVYYGVFAAVGHAGWLFGLALGAVQALGVGTLVDEVLPAIHPRMGTPWSDAEETPLLEPPGFLLMNYGRSTVVVTSLLHLAFGAIVGGFTAGV